jgi:hypothetical protein
LLRLDIYGIPTLDQQFATKMGSVIIRKHNYFQKLINSALDNWNIGSWARISAILLFFLNSDYLNQDRENRFEEHGEYKINEQGRNQGLN